MAAPDAWDFGLGLRVEGSGRGTALYEKAEDVPVICIDVMWLAFLLGP